MPATQEKTRTERLNVRVTSNQARLIRRAAKATRANLSTFLVESACLRAEEALASEQHFIYTARQWDSFIAVSYTHLDVYKRQVVTRHGVRTMHDIGPRTVVRLILRRKLSQPQIQRLISSAIEAGQIVSPAQGLNL